MSSASGPAGRTVINRLQSKPHGFELPQVFRIFRRLEKYVDWPVEIDITVSPMPRYSHYEILSVTRHHCGWRVECRAPALTGSRGVLPFYLRDTALALEIENGDRAMADFFSMFEAPWLSRLARGCSKYDLCALNEEPRRGYEHHGVHVSTLLEKLLPQARMGVYTRTDLLRYTCLMGRWHRHLEGLRAVLSDYFQLKVVVRAATPRRHRLAENSLVKLGATGVNNELGHAMLLGSGGYLDSWRIDILLMPVNNRELMDILNNPSLIRAVSHITGLYLGDGTPSTVYVMAHRRFLHTPPISSKTLFAQLGQSFCLAPERHPDGVVRIRMCV
ncbi:type VI secretion system baseplate subunit TssG [Sansalvadorimonas sp. 2012CJ34-2]|uniref:Type VI secretion system baseplate subunit TssG n=1 Tax=Parendozoicomonas callyspongiae TaxID=2942213 RepID=A0ABT0PJF3_9GAMM|nr:type VI secretion system baseplate subunit TssG [Sansalvadorimonas sp. 2012CJ34-2]MCL6271106.1 type VI secretion system baseplate subunit TssG [Sansalvadorimonas sp. 2012CJ34-2]